jgi:hypothetical protein
LCLSALGEELFVILVVCRNEDVCHSSAGFVRYGAGDYTGIKGIDDPHGDRRRDMKGSNRYRILNMPGRSRPHRALSYRPPAAGAIVTPAWRLAALRPPLEYGIESVGLIQ